MTILFRGGRVFDGTGTVLDGHSVLVDGNRIARVAPGGEFEGYAGRVIDTAGHTLLPGLIDCHVHLIYEGEADPRGSMERKSAATLALTALRNARTLLEGGITAVRDCGGKDYIEFAARDAIRRGEFPGPTIHAAGRMICMTGGHGNAIGRVADGPDEVVKAVREQVHAGCDLVKIMATGGVMTPGVNPEDAHYSAAEMAAGIHEAKRFHRRTASHAQGTEGILNAVRGGIDSIEHGIFMSDECIAEMIAAGTWLVPTLSALRNIMENRNRGIAAYVVEKTERVSVFHRDSVKRYHAAGGKLAMGTDAGTPFNRHGVNAMELAFMVEIGIPASDALVAATGSAADLMGLDDHGRIAEGALADLLLVAGDPLADIAMAADRANHRGVWKAGQPVAGTGAT